ncbi:nitrous oxide reductase accessory protein NosL [Bacillus rubiinfantis]|uniref:nitrous oxide reductase accessory protein NosL n=1 Tax=Bacillus rubiinfantis TaxID=1499680 RepID=UPI0005AA6280|nr:nitrous oxide reductase accessory protein NosL [Bacillus rubiinfantis]
MKLPFFKSLLLLFVLLLVVSGCGKTDYKPAAINEETDKCDVCNMAVKDDGFAAQIVLENEKNLLFDDIGCLYKWKDENKDKKIGNSFIKDYQSKEWLELDQASFVYEKSIRTPMAYNVIAFSDKKAAEKFIDEHGGQLLTADDLTSHTWERNKEMMKEMKKKMHMHN